MKPYLFFIVTFLCLQYAKAFENPFDHVPGTVLLVKETKAGDVLVVIDDYPNSEYQLYKLNAKGQILCSVSLGQLDSLYRMDQIYETSGGYGITYSIGKSSSYLVQVFHTFDTQLNQSGKNTVQTTDSVSPQHHIWYEINENLTWVGVIHAYNQSARVNMIQFGNDGTVIRPASVIDTFLYEHSPFVKVFTHTDSSITCFASQNSTVQYYEINAQGQTTIHDSIMDLYMNNDSFGHHHFFRDMEMIRENVFVGLTSYHNGTGKYGIKLWELERQKISRTKVLFHTDTLPSYEEGTGFNNSLSLFQNQLFVKESYMITEGPTKEKIYRIDTAFTQTKDWSIFENIDMGSFSTIYAGQNGSCFIGGHERDSLGNSFIYLAKIDSAGTVTYVTKFDNKEQHPLLYPNPGKDILYGVPAHSEFELMDMSGKKRHVESNGNGFDVSVLEAGIYFYRIYDELGGLLSTGKWVKE